MVRKRSYEIDMCSGAILPKLLQFALPLMLSSVLQLLFNAADIVVVGRFAGDNSLAAVGSTSSLINLLVNLFIGLSVGANILAARYYGANDHEGLTQTVHTSMLLSVIGGVFLGIFGFLLAGPLLTLMQSPAAVRDLATLYLRIYFLGMPATLIYNFGAALLRASGDTQRPLYYLLVSGILNLIMNLILVIVFHMGVAGVAIATVFSQCISAALIVRCLVLEPGGVHLVLSHLHIWPARLKEILRIGLPSGLQGMLFSLSNVVIQSSVNSFGEIVVAGSAASSNIEGFVYAAMTAFSQADMSFTSQNLGAGRYDRIRSILFRSLICVVVTGFALSGLAILFGPQLLGIYSGSPAVVEAGMSRLVIILSTYAICGMMDVMVGSLRGLGQAVLPMIVSLIGACGLRLVWIATVFQIPRFHAIETVYFSYPISWILTFLAHVVCFTFVFRRLKRHQTES